MVNAVKPAKQNRSRKPVQPAAAKKSPAASSSRKKPVMAKKVPVKKGKNTVGKKPVTTKSSSRSVSGKKIPEDMTRYRCRLCGYIYSPLRGEPHNGIPEGTAFENLPDDYVCPVCGQQGKGRIGTWGFEAWRPTRYLCSLCSYVYDEARGEPHRGIKPGTKFEDLPEDYSCPVCAMDPKIRMQFGKVFKNGFEPLNI